MRNLFIVGAGSLGRELAGLITTIQRISPRRWNVVGFLDDTENPLGGRACDYEVVGTIRDYRPQGGEALAMGIADPAAKHKLSRELLERGATFESIIHPHAYLGHHNNIGMGVIIYAGFGMTVNCQIGDFCTLLDCTLGHDVKIGSFSTLSSKCHLMGGVTVGSGVYMGGNAAVAPHVSIGDSAFVCIGSVLMKDVPARAKVMGNPAREIG